MERLKIKKEFWEAMVSGKKIFEFRKLEKGLTTGTYKFVSIPEHRCPNCKLSFTEGIGAVDHPCNANSFQAYNVEQETFGTAQLKPKSIRPYLTFCEGNCWSQQGESGDGWACEAHEYSDDDLYEKTLYSVHLNWEEHYLISKETYDFVKENYIDKKIDIIVYEISNVKENNENKTRN